MKQSLINKLKEFFSMQPVEKAWVFGSYSRGEETITFHRLPPPLLPVLELPFVGLL